MLGVSWGGLENVGLVQELVICQHVTNQGLGLHSFGLTMGRKTLRHVGWGLAMGEEIAKGVETQWRWHQHWGNGERHW
jgi:hypothetical protein